MGDSCMHLTMQGGLNLTPDEIALPVSFAGSGPGAIRAAGLPAHPEAARLHELRQAGPPAGNPPCAGHPHVFPGSPGVRRQQSLPV